MSYSVSVEVLEEVDDLCDVEDAGPFCQLVEVGLDETDELSALTVLLHEVQRSLVLEGVAQLNDSRVLEVGQQLSLHQRLVLLLFPLQLPLLNLLQGVGLEVAVLDDQKDVSVGALPEPVLQTEVLNSHSLSGRRRLFLLSLPPFLLPLLLLLFGLHKS